MTRLARHPAKTPTKQTRSLTKRASIEVDSSRLIDDEAQESDGDGVVINAIYEPDFIEDGVQEEGLVFGIPDLTPEPSFPLTQQTPTKSLRVSRKQESMQVIDLDSSNEDLEAMDVDDSCWIEGDCTTTFNGDQEVVLPHLVKRSSDPNKEWSKEEGQAFMDKYIKSKALGRASPPDLPRIDFDQLELAKGLAASRFEASKAAKSRGSRESPVAKPA
ncbi:hypothetical protein C8F04DRAFT_1282365 [Mycena alexandri]|uniref:Uncharacterized protein n=1 Tax=Mycena alexandri TaxID=1745969 RepID=A0AAD6RVR7_9AGAR|nr:hypothetical protein C8F04DRAFT_1282365 [Mycena alexandri]